MATYNKKIVDQIATLIEEGNYSISNICIIVGISRKTFYDWKNNHSDFQQAIEDAEQRRTDELQALASKALKKKLEGYYQTVSRTVYIPSENDPETLEIKQHVVTRKYCEPDTKLLLEILRIRGTGKKKKGLTRRNSNPTLIVKRNKENIQSNINEVPPFTLKAKEIVEQTIVNNQQQTQTPDSNKTIKEEISENKTQPVKSKEEPIQQNKQEQSPSTSYPLPPGYTRRE